MKAWWAEGNFRSKSLLVRWPIAKFWKKYLDCGHTLAIIFGRKNASLFPEKWVLIIHQILSNGSILIWGDIISSNLDNQLKKAQKDHEFYMASYLMNVMRGSWEYLEMGWNWYPSQSSIHVYCKVIWENKYKEDYERICNGLFTHIHQVLFGEEVPCISSKVQTLVQKYGSWYMTPDGVYMRMINITKDPHWIPHFIPYKLMLQEIAYQTHINNLSASLIKSRKGAWPPFSLSTKVCRMENIKPAKGEVSIISSFKFREEIFRRHDLEGLLKRHLKQINFIWPYADE